MAKLPFAGGVFWKTLAVVVVLVVIAWWVVVRFFGYQMTSADYGGSTLSTIIFAYLVHLWLLPGEELDQHGEGDQGGSPNADDEPPRTTTLS